MKDGSKGGSQLSQIVEKLLVTKKSGEYKQMNRQGGQAERDEELEQFF